MKTNLLIRARKHFACGVRSIDRHNMRSWVRSLRYLGNKWIMLNPVPRSAT